jgi:hypothetical protein
LAANIKTFVPEGFGLMFCLCSEDSFLSFVVAAISTSARSVGVRLLVKMSGHRTLQTLAHRYRCPSTPGEWS